MNSLLEQGITFDTSCFANNRFKSQAGPPGTLRILLHRHATMNLLSSGWPFDYHHIWCDAAIDNFPSCIRNFPITQGTYDLHVPQQVMREQGYNGHLMKLPPQKEPPRVATMMLALLCMWQHSQFDPMPHHWFLCKETIEKDCFIVGWGVNRIIRVYQRSMTAMKESYVMPFCQKIA